MIGNLFLDTSKVVKLTRPLSYEYDTETQSVVLLDGYEYTVAYKRASRNLAQTIDLRLPKVAGVCSINNPRNIAFDDDFYYTDGLRWSISIDGAYVADVWADNDESSSSTYVEEVIQGEHGVTAEYNSGLYLNNMTDDIKIITLVPSDPSLVDFSGININNPGSFSLDADGTVTICLGTTGSIITGTDSGDVE